MSENRFWNLLGKKLSGDATSQEISELEQLMKENPEWVFAAEHIQNMWKREEHYGSAYDAELAFQMHLNKLKGTVIKFQELETPLTAVDLHPPYEKHPKRRIARISLFILFPVFIAAGFWQWQSGKREPPKAFIGGVSEVSTPPGSKSTRLVLPDSSVVWLNAGSKLSYDEHFGKSNRNTRLVGEGYFEVKKSTVPFIIHTNEIQIKVLGTAFNVRSYENEKTETSLIRGKIEITMNKRPGEKIILRPNEKLVIAPESKTNKALAEKNEPVVVLTGLTRAEDRTIVETSWKDNRLVFQDESFADLARQLERWYNVQIDIRDEVIARSRLTGAFETETILQALTALQMVNNFNFTISGDQITITPQ